MKYEWFDDILPENKDTILGSLEEERIVSFSIGKNGLQVVEQCDQYFGSTLTLPQLDRLISELKGLRAKMKPE